VVEGRKGLSPSRWCCRAGLAARLLLLSSLLVLVLLLLLLLLYTYILLEFMHGYCSVIEADHAVLQFGRGQATRFPITRCWGSVSMCEHVL
jgi:hypothetical protein